MNHAVSDRAAQLRPDLEEIVSREVEPRIEPEFILTLAHEIRNILSPLGSSAQLLDMPDVDEHSARRAKAVISRQVRHLRRLVNDLLDAHRLEHHEVQLLRSSTDLTQVVEAICDDHRPVFAARGITLVLESLEHPLRAEVDVDRLDQALNNLLSNSLKFTDRGGRVRVGLSIDGASQCAIISVQDTGVGIDPAWLDLIFDSDAHESSYRNRSGLGLGLPLARRLVELHGGRLEAHSDGPGTGAEFKIFLPLAASHAARP